jgi:signal transduction histidine kinase/ActR/RegA family two-component response regulator
MTTANRSASPHGALRRKLLVLVMGATLAALLMSATALLLYEVRTYRKDGLDDLASQAGLLAQSVAPALAFDDPKAAGDALAALKLRPQIRAAAVYRADGRVFATYVSPVEEDGRAAIPPHPGPPGARFDSNRLTLVQPIAQNGEALGAIYLQALHDARGRVLDYLWIVGLAMAAGLGLAALIFRQLHPSVTRPILAVADASRRLMEERNFDIRVSERSDDEVGVLVDAFNNMVRELADEMRERHNAEEALRAADRRKDEFLATLAHELRNPLAPLTNALALLERGDADPDVRARARAIMERQLGQLVRLIDDLLEVSRITRGKLELRPATVDLVAVVKAALEAAEPALRAKSHVVRAFFAPSPVWVRGDAARLMQVFVNLLHNAAKYTESGGHVDVSVKSEEGVAVAAVHDDGIGIDPADQKSVFDMFVQLDKSLGRGAAGLGVGLTIARQLVELHGGTLAVQSAGRGQGSIFSVRLPLIAAPREAAASAAAPSSPAAVGDGLDVLIADDNTDFAESLAGLMRMHGHRVRVVHDGLAAVQAAVERAPDAAFIDIGMPGLNGYEVARRLRARRETEAVPLVAVTGWGQEADRQRVREAGYDHHWVKPVDVQRVLGLLETLRLGRLTVTRP